MLLILLILFLLAYALAYWLHRRGRLDARKDVLAAGLLALACIGYFWRVLVRQLLHAGRRRRPPQLPLADLPLRRGEPAQLASGRCGTRSSTAARRMWPTSRLASSIRPICCCS